MSPDNRWLVTSNYADGSYSVIAVEAGDLSAPLRTVEHSVNSGKLGPHVRQDAPHAHYAQFVGFAEAGARLYTCDLGLDALIVFEFDTETGQLHARGGDGAALPAGAGPRHLALHPSLPVFYVSGELDTTLYVYRGANANEVGLGTLELVQAVRTLPPNAAGENYSAAIKISPDGRVVTVSNRGRDSLASFRIDPDSGLLTPLGEVPCGGRWPRDFAYVGGDLLVVANEWSDNLTAFRIGADGLPAPINSDAARLQVPSPACVVVSLVD